MAELALFFSAFLAATLLPFSSEVTFAAALSSGMDKSLALFAASSGNILAIMLNYFLGYLLAQTTQRKLENSKYGTKALAVGHRYGYWGLLLSWLPLIGDPLTLVAGILRLNFILFIVIAASLRVGRYLLISEAF